MELKDLSSDAFAYFKQQAIQTKRLDKVALEQSQKTLIEQLRLNEKTYLKRAAILLFHPEPEIFFTGAYIKIGYFRTYTDLRFQDEVHGYLFEQVEKTMDLLLSKYLEAQIRYQGISRIEEYAYPESALREAVLNAVAHKDYSSGNPIQIKVYDDHISIWNAGQLPEPLTIKKLLVPHPSLPFNPDVATTFFRAGLIEAWGRGTIKIVEDCKAVNTPVPTFSNEFGGFEVVFKKSINRMAGKVAGKVAGKIIALVAENENITIPELAEKIGVSERTIERNIQKLKEQRLIERIGRTKGGYWKLL
ncbi:MAG: ATP-binding protein [Bacteroidota bacterium]